MFPSERDLDFAAAVINTCTPVKVLKGTDGVENTHRLVLREHVLKLIQEGTNVDFICVRLVDKDGKAFAVSLLMFVALYCLDNVVVYALVENTRKLGLIVEILATERVRSDSVLREKIMDHVKKRNGIQRVEAIPFLVEPTDLSGKMFREDISLVQPTMFHPHIFQ